MLKVLFLTHKFPYPPVSGGATKRWKLIEYLSSHCSLSIAALCSMQDLRWKDAFLAKTKASLFCAEAVTPRRNVANLAKSYLQKVPLSVYRNHSDSFKNHVEDTARKYDILFVDSYLMLQYVPSSFAGRVILHEHNAEYVLWERFAGIERNVFKKAAISLEAKRIRKYQQMTANKAHLILAAPHDIEVLERLGIESCKFRETFHFGDESLLHLPDVAFEKTENALLHVGTLDWEPNAEGLIRFIESAWDLLKKENPTLRLYAVGRNPGKKLKALVGKKKDIILTGFVENLEEYYAKCRVFIAPLRFGSGIKVKIVNAMYRGIPTVTTPIGVEGLEVEDGRHLLVAKDIQSMLAGIGLLLAEKDTWERLRDESRRLAGPRFRWERVHTALHEALQLE